MMEYDYHGFLSPDVTRPSGMQIPVERHAPSNLPYVTAEEGFPRTLAAPVPMRDPTLRRWGPLPQLVNRNTFPAVVGFDFRRRTYCGI